ncbi:MAG TPA: hypothetical protein VKT18_08995, partial [Acidimicrobiales bacterium]|nr:hypothetical protein [Acidimicrobiales bacterium]
AGGAILGAPCTRLGRRTAATCDLLGDLHDGARANEWLDGVEVERPHAFAVARLRAAEIGRMAEARGAWRASWERVGLAAEALGVRGG